MTFRIISSDACTNNKNDTSLSFYSSSKKATINLAFTVCPIKGPQNLHIRVELEKLEENESCSLKMGYIRNESEQTFSWKSWMNAFLVESMDQENETNE